MKRESLRVIGIDPTTRGFAYALIEGPESVADWGLAQLMIRTDEKVLARIEEILDRSLPALLVLEDGRGTRRRARARRIIKGVKGIARQRKLPVVFVSRARLKEVFLPASTKQEIAEAIAARFPELRSRLPRQRKPWQSEDERMSIFDALSFCFAAIWK